MLKSVAATLAGEFKALKTNKLRVVILFLIPVLSNIMFGLEFSGDQIRNIPMAVLDQDNSQLSRTIVEYFRENEVFDIKYMLDDSEKMKELFNESKINVGMIIAKGFSEDVKKLDSPSILMLYDGSQMSVASSAKTRASEILLTVKAGIVIKQLEGRLNMPAELAQKTAQAVRFENRTLYNPSRSFKNFLVTGLGTAIVQNAIAMLCAVAVKNNELEVKKRKRAGYIIGKIMFYGLSGGLVLFINVLLQAFAFKIPFRGNLSGAALLCFLLAFAVSSFSIMVSSLIRYELFSITVNAVVIVPSTLYVGYTWPLISMPGIYQKIAMMLPFYHFADNMRNMFLKGINISSIYRDIVWYIFFIVGAAFIAVLASFRLKAEKYGDVPELKKEGGEAAIS